MAIPNRWNPFGSSTADKAPYYSDAGLIYRSSGRSFSIPITPDEDVATASKLKFMMDQFHQIKIPGGYQGRTKQDLFFLSPQLVYKEDPIEGKDVVIKPTITRSVNLDFQVNAVNTDTLRFLRRLFFENHIGMDLYEDSYATLRTNCLLPKEPGFIKVSLRCLVNSRFYTKTITLQNEYSKSEYKIGPGKIQLCIYSYNGNRYLKVLRSSEVSEVAFTRVQFIITAKSKPLNREALVTEEYLSCLTDENGSILIL